ncbi:unnamed protein product, partial [Polarella glacialis]
DVAGKLDLVVNSSDLRASTDFPSCLSAEERKYIHHISEQFGLKHESRGRGDGRYITVTKDPAKAGRRGLAGGNNAVQDQPRLRLPPAAWEVLEHPLVQHSAQQGNAEAAAEGAPLVA